MPSDSSFQHIIQLTASEYQRYEDLPFAVFLTTLDGQFLQYNEECRLLFGLPDEGSSTTNLCDYYVYLDERDYHIRELHDLPKDKWLRNTTLDLEINGEIRHVRDHSKAIWNETGDEIVGILCIMIAISKGDRYNRLFKDVPIGLYKVRINSQGDHELVYCNDHFAKHLGFDNPVEVIGRDVRDFHPSVEEYEQFEKELVETYERGQFLVDYIVNIRDQKGEERKLEVHINLLKDREGNIIGRVGAERDVTDYWETKQQLNELTTDFGKVLHSYSSTLIHSKHTMDAVIRSFIAKEEKNPQTRQLDEEKVSILLQQQIGVLLKAFDRFWAKNEEVNYFKEQQVHQIQRILSLIARDIGAQLNVQHLAIVRDGSIKIREDINEIDRGHFPKELLKEIRQLLTSILKLCSLVTLSRGVETVLEMETVVNNLRSYILTRVKQAEQLEALDIYDIMIGVVKNMGEYATKRNIELRANLRELRDVRIDGFENDLVRALLNILHNAIKYSWERRPPAIAFVAVDGKVDRDWVYIQIENWGVPITEEEIQQGLIYKVGYRGINSSDRRRPGTGLGLYDSLKVIEKHKGDMIISSQPSLGNAKDDYSNPFITRVNLKLARTKPSL
ncbi:MAG: PAS domain-containing protein [Saprospiraceae bacterium]|nr:PAS domain-containing protein [Saprospiraceae bacterium]